MGRHSIGVGALPPVGGGLGGAAGDLPAGSVDADEIAEGVVPTGVRRAALFDGALGGAETTFTNSTQDLEVRFSLYFLTTVSVKRTFFRLKGAGDLNVQYDGATKELVVRILAVEVGRIDITAYLDSPFDVVMLVSSSTVVLSSGGVELISIAHAQPWSTSAQTVAMGAYTPTSTSMEGAIWGVHLIDPNDDTNTAHFALDGDFLNSHPSSTVPDATLTGDIEWVTVLGDSTKPMLAVPYQGVATGVRRGALFGAGIAAVSWVPTTPSSGFGYEFSVVHDGAAGVAVGRSTSGRASVAITADGKLALRENQTNLAESVVLLEEGVPSTFRVDWTTTGATVTQDGVVVWSPTWVAVVWGTSLTGHFIGAQIGTTNEYAGTLFDVSLIDPLSDANTGVYRLDGDFLNTHPGSTVADATVTGFVDFAEVLSADGGKPVRAGQLITMIAERGSGATNGQGWGFGNGTTDGTSQFSLPFDAALIAVTLTASASTPTFDLDLHIDGASALTVPLDVTVSGGSDVVADLGFPIAAGATIKPRIANTTSAGSGTNLVLTFSVNR